ncbi:hypothetical protein JW992_04045 [candidate division KSB1 bacterium]|nr:hypothetical protein [candidate division KSB1 bacterium]
MRTYLFRFALFCFACFALLVLFAAKMDPLLAHWGDPQEIHSLLTSVFLTGGVAGLALIFVRTIVGLIVTFLLMAIAFILAYYFLGPLIGV